MPRVTVRPTDTARDRRAPVRRPRAAARPATAGLLSPAAGDPPGPAAGLLAGVARPGLIRVGSDPWSGDVEHQALVGAL